ncbi:MAG TPA: DHCW motif cupin fold protein [Prolixibacteraceae bacterium]|nr:DHCW motif cupin fold protein [Prolixibacteraceae bacterium]
MKVIPFQVIDWSTIQATEHTGVTGKAFWQTLQFDGLRVRIVEYSAGYLADHWCAKGHIVHCLEGEVENQLITGESNKLTPGMTYVVTDDASQHRSYSENGVKLLIIDGDFLKV